MNQSYTVKAGDTLYGISNQFGVSVNDILKINDVNPSNLQIGQVLKIPMEGGTNPGNTVSYTVKKGDSLYSIANRYNTTVSELQKLNNLTSSILQIGDILLIPENYDNSDMNLPSFVNYIVKKGDSLYKIAKDNNISVETIIKDNSLNSNNLNVGQILKIRIANNGTGEYEECFGEDYIPPSTGVVSSYIVKKGDSLYSIANKFNTSVNTLMNLNNLKNNNLSIGQVLIIPGNNANQTITYTVKKGDSLYSIAKKYNTTVDSIKRKNNLVSNSLAIGQVLNI